MHKSIHRAAIYLALIAIFIFACKPQQEKVVQETFPDGSPKMVHYISKDKDSKSNFVQNSFYQGNKKQSEGEIRNGKMEGKWTYYYENGKVWSEGYFKQGLEEGVRTAYFENGQKRYQGVYKDGKRIGKWKFWDMSGNLVHEEKY